VTGAEPPNEGALSVGARTGRAASAQFVEATAIKVDRRLGAEALAPLGRAGELHRERLAGDTVDGQDLYPGFQFNEGDGVHRVHQRAAFSERYARLV
jgi:hypothetical protein